jgi:methyl-accepting chemotaxis protein
MKGWEDNVESNKRLKGLDRVVKVRFSLQVKLTIAIVILMFLIISLRSTVLGIVQSYVENTLLFNLVSAGVSILLGAIGAYLIIRFFVKKPLHKLTELAHHLAENDFTKRIELRTGDEFQQLTVVFNDMAEKMQILIKEIQQSSVELNNKNNEVKAAAKETQSASEQIAASMQQVASGNDQIETDINSIVETAHEIAASSQQVAKSVQQADESATEIVELVIGGGEAVTKTIGNSENVKNRLSETLSNVMELDTKSDEIDGIINMIDDIAEQTNLLALNAAIEAARAGESGRGFAVVADEVRKLATQSSSSTDKIQSLISDVKSSIKRIVDEMKMSDHEVSDMAKSVNDLDDIMRNINKSSQTIKQQTSEISAAVQELAAGNEQVVESTTNTASVIEQSKAGVQEVASSSQQQNATMNHLTDMCDSLHALSSDLNDLVRKFKV